MLRTVAAQVAQSGADAETGRLQTGANFAGVTFVGSLQRKKGCLERSKRKRSCIAASGSAAGADSSAASAAHAASNQAEFAHQSQLPGAVEKLQVSKAWAHGRSAKQAAGHVQAEQIAAAANACAPSQKAAKGPTAVAPYGGDVLSTPTRSQPRRSAAPALGKYTKLAEGADDDLLDGDM
jgi:hypothetical protein